MMSAVYKEELVSSIFDTYAVEEHSRQTFRDVFYISFITEAPRVFDQQLCPSSDPYGNEDGIGKEVGL